MAAWDKRLDESALAYHYFCVYRDMGPTRTTIKTARQVDKDESTIGNFCAEYGWVERADQWDAHVRAVHDRSYLHEAMRAGRQRASVARALMGKVAQALTRYSDERLAKASLYELAQVARISSELQRLEEGLATAHVNLEMNDVRTVLAIVPDAVRERLVSLLAVQTGVAPSGSAGSPPLALPPGDEDPEPGEDPMVPPQSPP